MNRKQLSWIVVVNVVVPLMVGLFIYLLFKPALLPTPLKLRTSLPGKNLFIRLLINSGPDFCWSYSFSSALFITNFLFFRSKLLALLTVLLIIFSEVVQIFLPRYFTFDWVDVSAVITAVGLSFLVLKTKFIWQSNMQDG